LKRTKLEDYLAILQILLINKRPLELSEIQNATRIDSSELEEQLLFLQEQNALKKEFSGAAQAFFLLPLGVKLVRYFNSKLLYEQ
jgi:DNA-binding transcriptional regulator GbsR (MarR family)